MKSSKLFQTLRAIGCAGLAMTFAEPLAAQNPFETEPQNAFERQIEQFSRMLPDNPAAKEQFKKGLAEMRKAFEEDAANPSKDGQPRSYEFRWESDSGDLGDLRMEFERMGGNFGEGLFDRFFGGRGFPPSGDSLDPFDSHPRGFHLRPWFDQSLPAPPQNSKNHPDELKKYRPVVERARLSTVQLLSAGNQIALGTVVTENGYVLTKRSELGRNPRSFEARLADGPSVRAHFVEAVEDYDLALLKLDTEGLTPAEFIEGALPVGSILAAADITENPAAAGVLSVLARDLSKGYLGIKIRPHNQGVSVAAVERDSAAAAAGIRPNDVINEIDGKSVSSPSQLIKTVSERKPDAMVEISYVRNGRERKTSAKLRSRAELAKYGEPLDPFDNSSYDLTSRMGANVNGQRNGYPSALQHDLPLSSNQMEAPLVDLDGNIVGINIARAGRVSTYALPASVLNEILRDLKLEEQGGAAPDQEPLPKVETADTNALREEVERAEQAIEAARDALRAAEDSARSAREALDRQH